MLRAQLLWFAIAFGMGALLPVQAGMNVRLRDALGSPYRASLVSFFLGTVALLVVVLLTRGETAEPKQAPWWAWVGGFIGATLVTGTVLLTPRLGAAALFAALVAGQLAAAALIDHFGLVGYPELPFSASRAVGIVLLLAGALLVLRR
ncbi:DMT family transporter [Archangium lansingense]|uniref:DMT family transporter n=1 Tax=Archangium lansingense TaxID=2995310 RepID=UPI003B82A6A6